GGAGTAGMAAVSASADVDPVAGSPALATLRLVRLRRDAPPNRAPVVPIAGPESSAESPAGSDADPDAELSTVSTSRPPPSRRSGSTMSTAGYDLITQPFHR